MSKENPGLSRGFCFAEFYNHAAAAAAKNALSAPDFRWTPPLPAAQQTLPSIKSSYSTPAGTFWGVQLCGLQSWQPPCSVGQEAPTLCKSSLHQQHALAHGHPLCVLAESCPCPCSLGERPLTISYAEPKQSEMNQDQVKSVYVGNLLEHTSEDSLRTYFEKLEMGKVGNIKLPCPGCTLLLLSSRPMQPRVKGCLAGSAVELLHFKLPWAWGPMALLCRLNLMIFPAEHLNVGQTTSCACSVQPALWAEHELPVNATCKASHCPPADRQGGSAHQEGRPDSRGLWVCAL